MNRPKMPLCAYCGLTLARQKQRLLVGLNRQIIGWHVDNERKCDRRDDESKRIKTDLKGVIARVGLRGVGRVAEGYL
jgi:hypothetical protein